MWEDVKLYNNIEPIQKKKREREAVAVLRLHTDHDCITAHLKNIDILESKGNQKIYRQGAPPALKITLTLLRNISLQVWEARKLVGWGLKLAIRYNQIFHFSL